MPSPPLYLQFLVLFLRVSVLQQRHFPLLELWVFLHFNPMSLPPLSKLSLHEIVIFDEFTGFIEERHCDQAQYFWQFDQQIQQYVFEVFQYFQQAVLLRVNPQYFQQFQELFLAKLLVVQISRQVARYLISMVLFLLQV